MGVKLIRTDKNGTKYFENDCCPKCDGKGIIKCYQYVEAGMCFLCKGTGIYITHWKEMTPEYSARLEAQRQARREQKEQKFHENISKCYKALGLNEEGHCFAVLDKTFGRKEELKAAGARFNGSWWYFSEPKEGWDTAEIDAKKFIYENVDKDCVAWTDGFELKQEVQHILKKRREAENSKVATEFYGSIGDRVDTVVTLERVFSFGSTDFCGNDCIMYGYKMADKAGHKFVWLTGCDPWRVLGIASDVPGDECRFVREEYEALYGKEFNLRGTVKGHKEREGLKETSLNRCKVVAA